MTAIAEVPLEEHCSEYGCPVGVCPNRVKDPLIPCADCLAVFGPHLQPSSREVSEEELAAQMARAEAKAGRAVSPAPIRRAGRPPRLSSEELVEEALHLIWCGVSREHAAKQLGVSKPVLEAAIRQAREAV